MTFLQLWLAGYTAPLRFIDELKRKPAPRWGFYAQSLRALLNALLLYLPLSLLGRIPSTPSYLTFLPTERYYTWLILIAPLFILTQWIFTAALAHLVLRLLGWASDFDRILNITGFSALVVGAVFIPWDWLWFIAGWHNPVLLGISHMILDVYTIVLITLGFNRTFKLPLKAGILLSLGMIAAGLPLAILFMRGPF